jgi:hypothetical protein
MLLSAGLNKKQGDDRREAHLRVQGEQLTSDGAHFGQDVVDAPDLALVAQTELTAQLELGVDALLLERATRCAVRGSEVTCRAANTRYDTEERGETKDGY